MPKRTQIVCMCEGVKGRSIDSIFANAFIKAFDPPWLRPFSSAKIRLRSLGDCNLLLNAFPEELKNCEEQGGSITLIVLADVDDDNVNVNCEALKSRYREKANEFGITDEQFAKVVFIFAKDRIENWIEFLHTGKTDEQQEGSRVENSKGAEAAKILAKKCKSNIPIENIPPSLEWSCRNWRAFVERMR